MKSLYTATLSILLMTGAMMQPAKAQEQNPSDSPGIMQQRTPDEVVNNLAEKLKLTDDQKNQIKPIIADRQQKMAALRSDSSMRPMHKVRKMKGIFKDSDKKIEAILNDQQKQQYIQMEQQMREQIRQRMQNRGAAAGGAQY